MLRACGRVLGLLIALHAGLARAQLASVDEPRGEAVYRIPLVVPPGPAGHGPELELVYGSGAARGGADWVGVGWSVAGATSTLQRDTRRGAAYDYENLTCGPSGAHPCYRSEYTLDGEPVVCEDDRPGCPDGVWRLRRDDGRVLERRTAGWVVRDVDGRSFVYGRESGYGDSEWQLVNPRLGPSTPAGRDQFAWLLESVTDVHGNRIEYTYDKASSPGVAYPKSIRYGHTAGGRPDREIAFDLETRSDARVDYRAGFRQETSRRLESIHVCVPDCAAGRLVTRYDLAYDSDPGSGRSLLASVQRVGSDGESALQPYRLTYATSSRAFASPVPFPMPDATYHNFYLGEATGDASVHDVTRIMVDMDGDALADLYDHDPDSGAARVWRGNGLRLLAPEEPWASSATGPFTDSTVSNNEPRVEQLTLDFDGDGKPDHVDGSGASVWSLRRGSAAGFGAAQGIPVPFLGWNETNVLWPQATRDDGHPYHHWILGLLDLTGDGRPERVQANRRGLGGEPTPPYTSEPAGIFWAVFPGRGSGFSASAMRWHDPFLSELRRDPPLQGADILTVDVNGDGLADRVSIDPIGEGSFAYDAAPYNRVALNHGAGFDAPEPAPAFAGAPPDALDVAAGVSCQFQTLVDLDGDGLLDHVRSAFGLADSSWRVRFGNGRGFGPAEVWANPHLGPNENEDECISSYSAQLGDVVSLLVDLDGDGLPDRLRKENGLARALYNDGTPPGLLLAATDPQGGRVELSYRSAAGMLDASGLPLNPELPVPTPVVSELESSDGRGGPGIRNRYVYAEGAFDADEGGFQGFGRVTRLELGAGTAIEGELVSLFATDVDCLGALEQQDVYDGDGEALLRRETHRLQAFLGSGAWGRCLRTRSELQAVEGTPAQARTRLVIHEYGDDPPATAFNLLRLEDWGEWDGSQTPTASGDERFEHYAYAEPRSDLPVVSRVAQRCFTGWFPALDSVGAREGCGALEGAGVRLLAHERFYYDDLRLGEVTNGRLTRRESLLRDLGPFPDPTGEWVGRDFDHDSRGNLELETGPPTHDDRNGLQTRRIYEATHAFPAEFRLGSDSTDPAAPPQVTQISYTGCAADLAPPPGLGLPCRVERPDGSEDRFGYDALGRLTRREHASGRIETRVYAEWTGPPARAEASVTTTALLGGGSPALVSKVRSDGLGRVFRIEQPGKASEVILVDRTYDARGRLARETLPFFCSDPGSSPPCSRSSSSLDRELFYDALGRITEVEGPDGSTRTLLRYAPWRVSEESHIDTETPSRQSHAERRLDGRGRLAGQVQLAEADPLGVPIIASFEYDAMDRLTAVKDPFHEEHRHPGCAAPDPCESQDHTTEVFWDTLGRRIRLQDPDSGVWTFRFDAEGRLRERRQEKTDVPELDRLRGPLRREILRYDALGRVVQRALEPVGEGTGSASFAYQNGRLREASNGISTHRFEYDPAGRLRKEMQITLGRRFVNELEYDALDRIRRRTFPDGTVFDYTYDGLRLVTIDSPTEPAVLKGASYDALGRIRTLALGRSGSSPVGTLEYLYAADARLDEIVGEATAPAGARMHLAVSIDGLGRLESEERTAAIDKTSFPAAPRVTKTFGYDGLSRLTEASGPFELPEGNGGTAQWRFDYDALGNLRRQRSVGGVAFHEREWHYGHSSKPRFLTKFGDGRAASGLVYEEMTADASGNVLQRRNTNHYAWNAINKLHTIRAPLGTFSRYAYGPFDAKATKGVPGEASIVYVGDDFQWDGVGARANKLFRVQGIPVASLATAFDPPAAEAAPWAIPAGHWLRASESALAAVVGMLGVLAVPLLGLRRRAPWLAVPGAGVLCAMLALLPRLSLAAVERPRGTGLHDEPILFYFTDTLGSIRMVLDRSGRGIQMRDYDPFGRELLWRGSRTTAGNGASHHRSTQAFFTGRERDEFTEIPGGTRGAGLYDYGARFYDPDWGRFISPDESVQGLDSQGLNPYTYVLNRPSSMIDPTGRGAVAPVVLMGQAVVGTVELLDHTGVWNPPPRVEYWLGTLEMLVGSGILYSSPGSGWLGLVQAHGGLVMYGHGLQHVADARAAMVDAVPFTPSPEVSIEELGVGVGAFDVRYVTPCAVGPTLQPLDTAPKFSIGLVMQHGTLVGAFATGDIDPKTGQPQIQAIDIRGTPAERAAAMTGAWHHSPHGFGNPSQSFSRARQGRDYDSGNYGGDFFLAF